MGTQQTRIPKPERSKIEASRAVPSPHSWTADSLPPPPVYEEVSLEDRLDRAARFGHRLAGYQLSSSGEPPIQRVVEEHPSSTREQPAFYDTRDPGNLFKTREGAEQHARQLDAWEAQQQQLLWQQYYQQLPPSGQPDVTTPTEDFEEAEESQDWDQEAWRNLRRLKSQATRQEGRRQQFQESEEVWSNLSRRKREALSTAPLGEQAEQHVETRHNQRRDPNIFKSRFLPGLDREKEFPGTTPRFGTQPTIERTLREPVGLIPRGTTRGKHVVFELQRGLRRAINPQEESVSSEFPVTAPEDRNAPLLVPPDPQFASRPHTALRGQANLLERISGDQRPQHVTEHLARLRRARTPEREEGAEYRNRGLVRQHAQFLQQYPDLRQPLLEATESRHEQSNQSLYQTLEEPPESLQGNFLNTFPEFVDLNAIPRRDRPPSPIRLPDPPRRDDRDRDRNRERDRDRDRNRRRSRSPRQDRPYQEDRRRDDRRDRDNRDRGRYGEGYRRYGDRPRRYEPPPRRNNNWDHREPRDRRRDDRPQGGRPDFRYRRERERDRYTPYPDRSPRHRPYRSRSRSPRSRDRDRDRRY